MPSNDLSQSEMALAAEHWRTDARELLQAHEHLTIMLPMIDSLAEAFVADQADPQAEVRERIGVVAELVARFDADLRGLDSVLYGLAQLERDPERRRAIEAVRADLFPGGRTLITRSVNDKAAEAQLMLGRVDESGRTLLDQLSVQNRSVLSFIVGTFLPETDALADAQAARMDAEDRASHRGRGYNLETRRRFLQIEATLRNLLDLHEAPPAVRRPVMGFVDQLIAQAERRAAARRNAVANSRAEPPEPIAEAAADEASGGGAALPGTDRPSLPVFEPIGDLDVGAVAGPSDAGPDTAPPLPSDPIVEGSSTTNRSSGGPG